MSGEREFPPRFHLLFARGHIPSTEMTTDFCELVYVDILLVEQRKRIRPFKIECSVAG